MDDGSATPPELEGPALEELSEQAPRWSPPERVKLRRLDVVVLGAILLASGAVLFARLSEPGKRLSPTDEQCTKYPPLAGAACYEMIPLDEVHYIPDARDVVRFGTDSDTRITGDDGAFVVHPPVGKWFIAAGISLFGDRPFGWRFAGALFGMLSVAVMYFLALRLWRSPWWAATAALLLAVEGLWFVQSRIAMLDIYAAAFALAGVWLLVEDRGRTSPYRIRPRWWRLGAALSFALALATKWQIAGIVAVAVAWSVGWDVARARASGVRRRGRFLATAGTFVLLPVLVYVATYTPWFLDSRRYNPPRCAGRQEIHVPKVRWLRFDGRAAQWLCYQREILDFHRHLKKYDKGAPAHPYFGEGYSWPWIGRPIAHAYAVTGDGTSDERRIEVLGLPNPAIWWPGFFIGIPALAWWALRRRDPAARLVITFLVAGFVPYMFFDIIRRPVFLFYATPIVPWVVLAVVHMLTRLVARWPHTRALAVVYVAIAVVSFAYFYPVLAAWPLSPGGVFGWQGRMWLDSDCTAEVIRLFCWI